MDAVPSQTRRFVDLPSMWRAERVVRLGKCGRLVERDRRAGLV